MTPQSENTCKCGYALDAESSVPVMNQGRRRPNRNGVGEQSSEHPHRGGDPYPRQVTCVRKNSATMVEGVCHAHQHAVKIPCAWGRRTITLFGYPSANERVYDRCLLYTMQRVRLHW